jgi:hypothetical protein
MEWRGKARQGPMKKRFSIWGREFQADRDTEIAQVDANPQAMIDALVNKTLSVNHSALPGGKKSKTRKYLWLRIVENVDGTQDQ